MPKGSIPRFDFNKYSYRNIQIDGSYNRGFLEGLASIADPNTNIQVEGSLLNPAETVCSHSSTGQHLLPTILGLKVSDKTYSLDDITVSAKNQGKDSYFDLEAPFASIHVNGEYDYATLTKSFTNLVASKLPTLPGKKTQPQDKEQPSA